MFCRFIKVDKNRGESASICYFQQNPNTVFLVCVWGFTRDLIYTWSSSTSLTPKCPKFGSVSICECQEHTESIIRKGTKSTFMSVVKRNSELLKLAIFTLTEILMDSIPHGIESRCIIITKRLFFSTSRTKTNKIHYSIQFDHQSICHFYFLLLIFLHVFSLHTIESLYLCPCPCHKVQRYSEYLASLIFPEGA